MPALWDKFWSSVQQAFFVCRDYFQLLSQAQVTPFGGVLVIFGFLQHALPWLNVVSDALIFEGPDVRQQWRVVTAFAVPHRMLARIVTLLEGLRGQASVILLVACSLDCCLVHHSPHFACAVQRAVLLDAAVTRPSTRVFIANGPRAPTLKYRAVVLPCHSCHINLPGCETLCNRTNWSFRCDCDGSSQCLPLTIEHCSLRGLWFSSL